jgi:hypothetical protein
LQVDGLKFRHHIRLWKSNFYLSGNEVWVWSAVYDSWYKLFVHKIYPWIDKERDYFLQKFIKTWLIKRKIILHLLKPLTWYNFVYDKFVTDGKVYLLYLK